MTLDELLPENDAPSIPPLEEIGDHNIHEILRQVTPMFANDFFHFVRKLEKQLTRWSIVGGYSRPGYHVYGLSGRPVDYVPSDHSFRVLVDKTYQSTSMLLSAAPEWADKEDPGISRGHSYGDFILCEGCGSIHRLEGNRLVAWEIVFINCNRIRYPTVFEGLWVGAEQLHSRVRT